MKDFSDFARLGGVEFTFIVTEVESRASNERVVECLLSGLAGSFILGEDTVNISASVGITLYPDDAQGVDDLLKNADTAMYAAKKHGRNRYCYFNRQ